MDIPRVAVTVRDRVQFVVRKSVFLIAVPGELKRNFDRIGPFAIQGMIVRATSPFHEILAVRGSNRRQGKEGHKGHGE